MTGDEEMLRMVHEAENAVNDAQEHLRQILTRIRLTEAEKEFVNMAAPKLVQLAFETLNTIPEERRSLMRAVVIAVAIGGIIAPSREAERGADMFTPQ